MKDILKEWIKVKEDGKLVLIELQIKTGGIKDQPLHGMRKQNLRNRKHKLELISKSSKKKEFKRERIIKKDQSKEKDRNK